MNEVKSLKVTITGTSRYSQSTEHNTPRLEGEDDRAFLKRTYREMLHTDSDGIVFIPGIAVKRAIVDAAIYKYDKASAEKLKTFVVPDNDLSLGLHKDEVLSEEVFVSKTGTKQGKRRVLKTFPVIPSGWTGTIKFTVNTAKVDKRLFESFLKDAGLFVGLGRFRPQNGGDYGRFDVLKVEWSD